MARSRNIKPAIMDNEELAALPALTRLLFIYMWMLADREGRIEDRPGRIKKQALGYDDGNAEEMLCQLQSAGFIDRYEVAGVRVIQVLNFAKHQTPHMREAVSELPSKVLAPVENTESTNLGSALHQTGTDLGSAEASPRSPDSGFLIPDSPYLIPDTKGESAARTPTAKKPPPPSIAKPDDVDAQTWADWVQLRKAKRTTASQTAVDGARVEAEKAGMPLVDFLKGCDRDGMQDQNGYRFHFYPAKQEMSETRTPHHYGYWRNNSETPQSPLDYASSTCLGGFNTIIYSLAGCGDVTEYLRNAYIYLNRHSPHDQLRFSSIRSFPWAEVVR